jgi:hypothetical protein
MRTRKRWTDEPSTKSCSGPDEPSPSRNWRAGGKLILPRRRPKPWRSVEGHVSFIERCRRQERASTCSEASVYEIATSLPQHNKPTASSLTWRRDENKIQRDRFLIELRSQRLGFHIFSLRLSDLAREADRAALPEVDRNLVDATFV